MMKLNLPFQDDPFDDPFDDSFDDIHNIFENKQLSPIIESMTHGQVQEVKEKLSALDQPLDQRGTYRLLTRCEEMPLAVVEQIVALGDPLDTLDEDDIFSLCNRYIQNDRADLLAYVFQHKLPAPYQLQQLLEKATLHASPSCLKLIITKPCQWQLNSTLRQAWVCIYGGNPTLDACIALLAPYFMDIDPHEKIPLHPKLTPQDLYFRCSAYSLGKFIATIPAGTTPKWLLGRFHDASFAAIKTHIEDPQFCNHRDFDGVFLSDRWIQPIPYPDMCQLMASAIDRLPHLLRNRKIRSLITMLALNKNPDPAIVACARALPGKALVIQNSGDMWIEEDGLLSRWKDIMPEKLVPTISRNEHYIGLHTNTLSQWLSLCKVSGAIPKGYISILATTVLELDHSNPTFLQALQPNGILHQERKALLSSLQEENTIKHENYLLILSMLSEGADYAL